MSFLAWQLPRFERAPIRARFACRFVRSVLASAKPRELLDHHLFQSRSHNRTNFHKHNTARLWESSRTTQWMPGKQHLGISLQPATNNQFHHLGFHISPFERSCSNAEIEIGRKISFMGGSEFIGGFLFLLLLLLGMGNQGLGTLKIDS